MKKITIMYALVLSIFGTKVYSQVDNFNFESAKTYENGNQIAYFDVVGIKDNHQAHYIQKKISEYNDIDNIMVLEKKNQIYQCMVECSASIHENIIQSYFNTEIEKYNTEFEESTNLRDFYLNLYSITDMPEYIDTGDRRNDVLTFKEKFEHWKASHPSEYKKIRPISIDIFIQ